MTVYWGYDLDGELNMVTSLCEIAFKYGTDKCPQLNHSYTPFYYDLTRDTRESVKKVLEIGIGGMREVRHIPHYIKGAGLRMWRDWFTNAQVYGADLEPELMFDDERIKTFVCDERNPADLKNLISQTGSDLDLVIDDASHRVHDQLFLCQTLMPMLDKKATYVIEDVIYSQQLQHELGKRYECYVPELMRRDRPIKGDKLVIVRHK